jgi:hypothetical protein
MPKIGATSENEKKKLPKENNHPIGENTPNLVPLLIRCTYYIDLSYKCKAVRQFTYKHNP